MQLNAVPVVDIVVIFVGVGSVVVIVGLERSQDYNAFCLGDADCQQSFLIRVSITFGTPAADLRHLDHFHANSTLSAWPL